MLGLRATFAIAGLLGVVCRRTAVFRAHRDIATSQGTVRGYLTPTHAAYYGIPYARPPTQTDRFKAPEPPPTWDGIFEAIHQVKCPQLGEEGDLNCLVINVFAPRRDTLLPVYVFVHDGDFRTGWGAYDPPTRLIKDGFVVVTFNYRLGALGFLCLGVDEALGNAGLKDQVAALHWIQANIEYFGGNPGEVIMHGVGSGAVSIQILLLSGLVDSLVHKVIVESGSVLAPSSMTYDHIATAFQGALTIDYEGTDDADELYVFYSDTFLNELIEIPGFLPCVENSTDSHNLIYFDPIQRLKEGNYNKVNVMITLPNTIHVDNNTESFDSIEDNIMDFLPSNLEFDDETVKEKVAQIVKDFYFGDNFGASDVEKICFDFIYDTTVEYPVVKFAMLYAANSPYMVYLMKFEMESGSDNESPVLSTGTIFENLYRDSVDNNDVYLEQIITLWKNFLDMGDPTPLTSSLIPIIWQPVVTDKGDRKAIANVPTLHFSNKMKMTSPSKDQRMLFWENINSKFYRPHVITQEDSYDIDDND